MLYFMLHDGARFQDVLRPALTASWRHRSFEPCRVLCNELLPSVAAFAERFHLGSQEPLIARVIDGLPFARDYWRSLVGEILLYGAAEVPDFQAAPETLAGLLRATEDAPRERFVPIQQAHFGARDLVLGGYYRPDAAGWNDPDDVARLATYLAGCAPERWTIADLPEHLELSDDDDRAEELAFARQGLAALEAMYRHAATRRQGVVCEVIHTPR